MLTETTLSGALRKELSERIQRNRRYSLRSFARDLGVTPGYLSLLLSGQRSLSPERARSIAAKLGLSDGETDRLVLIAEAEGSRGEVRRTIARRKLAEHETRERGATLTMDLFQAVSDWYHYAILELIENPKFSPDPSWISEKLGISKYEAELALARLKKLGLVVESAKGLRNADDMTISPSGIPSAAIQKHHRQVLQKAIESLDLDAVQERDFASVTFTIDPSKMELARAALRDFRRNFAAEFGAKKSGSRRVYALGVQLFPLETRGSRKAEVKK